MGVDLLVSSGLHADHVCPIAVLLKRVTAPAAAAAALLHPRVNMFVGRRDSTAGCRCRVIGEVFGDGWLTTWKFKDNAIVRQRKKLEPENNANLLCTWHSTGKKKKRAWDVSGVCHRVKRFKDRNVDDLTSLLKAVVIRLWVSQSDPAAQLQAGKDYLSFCFQGWRCF
jgi:hypothetical protein